MDITVEFSGNKPLDWLPKDELETEYGIVATVPDKDKNDSSSNNHVLSNKELRERFVGYLDEMIGNVYDLNNCTAIQRAETLKTLWMCRTIVEDPSARPHVLTWEYFTQNIPGPGHLSRIGMFIHGIVGIMSSAASEIVEIWSAMAGETVVVDGDATPETENRDQGVVRGWYGQKDILTGEENPVAATIVPVVVAEANNLEFLSRVRNLFWATSYFDDNLNTVANAISRLHPTANDLPLVEKKNKRTWKEYQFALRPLVPLGEPRDDLYCSLMAPVENGDVYLLTTSDPENWLRSDKVLESIFAGDPDWDRFTDLGDDLNLHFRPYATRPEIELAEDSMHFSLVLPAANAGFIRPPPSLPRIHTIQDNINGTNGTNTTCIPGVLPNSGVGYFQQRLDHSNPHNNATFSQKYIWSNDSWGGPGYPVILMTPGEQSMDGFCKTLTNISILGQMALRVKGAVVIIEHRYYGDSSPFAELNTETLQQLTLDNAIHDLTHFAKTVELPFDKNGSSNAPRAPWILSGGSYAGALSAWTARLNPGTFWAYHASSAPVQAVYDFWQYFEPIRHGMASNCMSNVAWFFKNKFLPGYCYDMFNYDEYTIGGNTSAPTNACLDTHNTTSLLYTDRAVNNSANVQWYWMLCNEPFAYWQTGSTPPGIPAIASRLMTAEYFQRQCDIYFGPKSPGLGDARTNATVTYGSAVGRTVTNMNKWTDGWKFTTKRMLWVNGEFDPWRAASVSSEFRPGGPLQSTPDSPVIIIKGGKHCEDFGRFNASANAYLARVQLQEVAYIAGWVDEFYDAAVQPGQNRTIPRFSSPNVKTVGRRLSKTSP
ncbi:hypothetical protein SBRCBS47491_007530 [Sporothrix bragantina]|uniref:Serine peptidase n=1 Tax=Sporothrix bragantina TaxID=671064 RepID=A0ABP0CGN5_9PEZI